ncbi:MAG: hypothetical protein ABFD80_07515, partial [Acidobacteriota bacterium]
FEEKARRRRDGFFARRLIAARPLGGRLIPRFLSLGGNFRLFVSHVFLPANGAFFRFPPDDL